ncbi:MAG: ribulose-phosphate 3-epimerase [Eubacterium sp.]|nr:ribulose-phosphate 3-epimerase [Eubacterium sp.]
MELILAPSMLSANFAHMESDLKRAMSQGVKWLHVDVMDGHFVPNISFGPPVISSVREAVPDAMLDVHMMVKEPSRFIEDYKACGAGQITVHAEATTQLFGTLQAIREVDLRAAVAINPATPVSDIEPVLELCDMVLVMSVVPGYGGQSLIPETLDKIKQLVHLREQRGLSFDIEIDGGVKQSNLEEVLDTGANVIVAGSAIFKGNIEENVRSFREIMARWREDHSKAE